MHHALNDDTYSESDYVGKYIKALLIEAFGKNIIDSESFHSEPPQGSISAKEYLGLNQRYEPQAYNDFQYNHHFEQAVKQFKANPLFTAKEGPLAVTRNSWAQHGLKLLGVAQQMRAEAVYLLDDASVLLEPEEIKTCEHYATLSPASLYWSFLDRFIDKKITLNVMKNATLAARDSTRSFVAKRLNELDDTDPKKVEYLASQETDLKRYGGLKAQFEAMLDGFKDPTRSFTDRLAAQAREAESAGGVRHLRAS